MSPWVMSRSVTSFGSIPARASWAAGKLTAVSETTLPKASSPSARATSTGLSTYAPGNRCRQARHVRSTNHVAGDRDEAALLVNLEAAVVEDSEFDGLFHAVMMPARVRLDDSSTPEYVPGQMTEPDHAYAPPPGRRSSSRHCSVVTSARSPRSSTNTAPRCCASRRCTCRRGRSPRKSSRKPGSAYLRHRALRGALVAEDLDLQDSHEQGEDAG